ncbi:MAG TPA: MMPL family transporter, partial [Mycobacterium sp.]|nr:MMPL family transporter [Mycobacterium sp.]
TEDHPDQVVGWAGWLRAPDSDLPLIKGMVTEDRKHTFVSIPLKGDDDDTILNNYRADTGGVGPDLQKLNGGDVELAGLQPIADALTGTIATDQRRMEVLALPMVAIVLFFVFGGVIAAFLPVLVGGLSIAGATGILRMVAEVGPVHFFAQPVVSLIGLGIAVDYGLFVVSRFREEIAEGYDTESAVRRTVITAGRTVVFSAVLIIASGASLLLLPQGFVKSLTYALIAAVALAALLSITLLPAILGVLGSHVDALGVRTLLRVPVLRDTPFLRRIIDWFAEKTQKTKTREEVEAGFWGRLTNFVMKRPLVFAIPIVIGMILLIIPLGKLSLGGMSEKYLPPNNPTRLAQENFDHVFPGYRTEQLTVVIQNTAGNAVTDAQVNEIRSKAAAIPGFTDEHWEERPCPEIAGGPCVNNHPEDPSVRVIQSGLNNRDEAAQKLKELRSITPPKGLTLSIGGTPALEQDSIHSLIAKAPLMLVVLLTTTMLLMFLAFGSLVLPIKAAVMSVLTLGSTMGILTWIFVEGHFAEALNFTPTPLMVVIIALVVAVGYGLATDYEVFLVSRMVEARESGMSTTESIRIGTATTGRLITAAALVLAVVAGSFVFSDLVMMKYLAFGLMAALLLDATVVRMFLVPAVMKLLGDDCWWAPRWMKRLQNRIGLGEIHLADERKRPVVRPRAAAGVALAALPAGAAPARTPHDPTRPSPGASRPGPAKPSPAKPDHEPPTTRLSAPGAPPTKRISRAKAKPAAPKPEAARPDVAQPQQEREIESWLGELRGSSDPSREQPSSEQTEARHKGGPGDPDAATTAIPTPP